MTGTCHCGSVSLSVSHRPEYVNFCDCSLCAKSGGVWGYYKKSEVEIDGPTSSYRRTNYEQPAVEMHFCPKCGTTTHWVLTEHFEGDQVGVNARLFEPADLVGVETRYPDRRNWSGAEKPSQRRAPGKLGLDAFL